MGDDNTAGGGTAVDQPSGGDGEEVQMNKSRCWACNKKVGLTGFKCRCQYVFCAAHRYADKHNCPIDYKSIGREEVAKHNPAIIASKVDKI